MKYSKVLFIFVLLSSTLVGGCINRPSNNVGYSIYLIPDENSEITLLIPVVIDKKYGEIDEVMFADPKYPMGNASVVIVETEKGSALKITAKEEVQIRFSKYYNESSSELMKNKTLSMTNITYDKNGKSTMKSWIFFNSTTNHTESYRSTLMAGDKNEVKIFEIGARDISNGWRQFQVKEGYGIS